MSVGGGSGGGGGSAGSIRAGAAFVEIWAKDNTAPGVARIAAGLRQTIKGLERAGNSLSVNLSRAAKQSLAALAPLTALSRTAVAQVARSAPAVGAALAGGLAGSAAAVAAAARGVGRATAAAMGSETAKYLRGRAAGLLTSALNSSVARAGSALGSRLGSALSVGLSRSRAFLRDNQTVRSFREAFKETADEARRVGAALSSRGASLAAFGGRVGQRLGARGAAAGGAALAFLRDNQTVRSFREAFGETADLGRRIIGPRLLRAISRDFAAGSASVSAGLSAMLAKAGAAVPGLAVGRRLAGQIGSGLAAAWDTAAPALRRSFARGRVAARTLNRGVRGAAGGLWGAAGGLAQVGVGLTQLPIGLAGMAVRGTGRAASAAGGRMASAGGLVAGAGGLAGLAVGGKVLETLTDTAKMATAARSLGMTEQAASGLFGALKQAGGDFKEDLEGVVQFNQKVSDALNGVGGPTGEAAKLFQGLSVQAKDLVGVPLDEKLYRVLDAIKELPKDQQAARLALVGGTDSLKKWLPLLDDSLPSLRDQAKGFEQSADAMQAQIDASRALTRAGTALDKVWQSVATALAPSIQAAAEWFIKIADPVREFVANNRSLVVTIAGVGVGVTAAGAAVAGLGLALSGAGAALALAGKALLLLSSPVGAVVVGLTALGAWWVTSTESGKEFGKWVSGGLTPILTSLGETLAWVGEALKLGDFGLAGRTAFAGLESAWADAMVGIQRMWGDFKQSLQVGLYELVARFKLAGTDIGQGIFNGLLKALGMIERNFRGSFATFARIYADFQEAIGQNEMAIATRATAGTIELTGADPTKAIKRESDRIFRKQRDEIRAERDKLIADANAARKEALTAAEAEAAAARERRQAAFDAVTFAQRVAEANQLLAQVQAEAEADAKRRANRVAGIAPPSLAETRGSFSLANAQQQFGGGSIAAQQLAEAKKAVEKLRAVDQRLIDLNNQLGELARNGIGFA